MSCLLGLPQELTGLSLKEVEDRLLEAYSSYHNSETKYSLKIAIDFTANGAFVATDDLDMQRLFIRHGVSPRFHKTASLSSFPSSELQFGFMTVIEEDINGQLTYYKAVKQQSTFEAEGSISRIYASWYINSLVMKASSWVRSFLSGREWTAPATIVSFMLESDVQV